MQRLSHLAKHLFTPLLKLGQPEMMSIDLENLLYQSGRWVAERKSDA